MDGRFDRIGCDEETEEACDICQRQRDQLMLEEDISWVEREGYYTQGGIDGETVMIASSEGEVIDHEVRARFEQAQRSIRYEQFKARQDEMRISGEVEMFEEQLGWMAGRCVGCFMATGTIEEDQLHERAECPIRSCRWWDNQAKMEERWQGRMFKKGVMGDSSGCFWCGVPQAICTHWEPFDDDQGTYRVKKDGVCQYAGVLVRLWAAATRIHHDAVDRAIGELDAARVYEWQESEDEAVYEAGLIKWLGEPVRWGHLQTNRLCQGFHRIMQLIKE